MAQWERVLAMQSMHMELFEQIKGQCQKIISMEARHCMANFLEGQLLKNILSADLDQLAIQFHTDLIIELEIQIQNQSDSDWCTKTRLTETKTYIQNSYACQPGKLFIDLRNYLFREKEMLDHHINTNVSVENDEISIVRNMLGSTLTLMRQNELDTQNLVNEYEQLRVRITYFNQIMQEWQCALEDTTVDFRGGLETEMGSQMAIFEQEINETCNKVIELRIKLEKEFEKMIQQINAIQNLVLNVHLKNWKVCQQKQVNGFQIKTTAINLDILQSWFENLVDILMNTSHNIAQILNQKNQIGGQENIVSDFLPKLKQNVDFMLDTLIKKSLVFEQQPPQVIRTLTRFQIAVRLLVGNALSTRLSNSKGLVKLVSGYDIEKMQQKNEIPQNTVVLDNFERPLEYNETTKNYAVQFRNLRFSSRPKTDDPNIKKDTETVLDEKFVFLVQVTVGKYQIFELSLPIAITVNSCQDPKVWASIFWDNAFSNISDPFTKVESGPWYLLAEALNARFEQELGRGLTAENLQCLFEKLCNIQPNSEINQALSPSTIITWSQFKKDNLPGRGFTFFEWLYAALKLIQHCFAPVWEKGYVEGFIQKSVSETKLWSCPNGTFLLRFSDSILGAISIAYVIDGNVFNIAPENKKDLEVRDLVTRIHGLQDLHYIYPNIPKNVINGLKNKSSNKNILDYIRTVDQLPSTSALLNSPVCLGNMMSNSGHLPEFNEIKINLGFNGNNQYSNNGLYTY